MITQQEKTEIEKDFLNNYYSHLLAEGFLQDDALARGKEEYSDNLAEKYGQACGDCEKCEEYEERTQREKFIEATF